MAAGGNEALVVAKMIKNLAQFDESSIMLSVLKIPLTERHQLRVTARHLLDGVSNKSVPLKKKEGKVVASPEAKFVYYLERIDKALTVYEQGDLNEEVDQLILDASFVGMDYEKVTDLAEVGKIHNQMIAVGETAQRIRLLAFYERGRFYQYLRDSFLASSWTQTCDILAIKMSSAKRYITLYQIIISLPRLLSTDLDMTEIIFNHRKLKEHLKVHTILYNRLNKPMRDIEIVSKPSRISSDVLPQGTAEVPDYDERKDDWADQWGASDRLRDVMDDEADVPLGDENFDESEDDYDENLSSRLVA